MKLHRFIGDFPLTERQFTVADAKLAHQLERVLSLRPGEEIVLGDGKGNEAIARIVGYTRGAVTMNAVSWRKNGNEPTVSVTLFLSLLKRESFELASQKATEVGVSRIVPVISARTVKLALRTDRLATIVKEAAEQSGRGIVPEVREPMRLRDAFELAGANELNLFFDKSGEAVGSLPGARAHTGIFIGPEGGWEADEVSLARARGCTVVSLGALTLRAETAAAIAIYLAAQKSA